MYRTLRTPDIDDARLQELLNLQRELSDSEIASMLDHVRPVVCRGEKLYYIELVDPRTIAFTWDPQPIVEATNLAPFATLYTLHSYGYYGMFKPSLAEVLAMIPQQLINVVAAFETNGPDDAQDLRRQWAATDAGWHVANTTLYMTTV